MKRPTPAAYIAPTRAFMLTLKRRTAVQKPVTADFLTLLS